MNALASVKRDVVTRKAVLYKSVHKRISRRETNKVEKANGIILELTTEKSKEIPIVVTNEIGIKGLSQIEIICVYVFIVEFY